MDKKIWSKGLSAIYMSHTKLQTPTQEVSDQWYSWLDKIPDDVFMSACEELCKRPGYPPQNLVGEIYDISKRIVDEQSGKLSPEQAYQIIEENFNAFYDPGMGGAAWTAIQLRLEKKGYKNLIPMAGRWGQEIWSGTNKTATRAQFLKAYEKQIEFDHKKQLGSGEFKKLEMPNVEQQSGADSKNLPEKP